MLISMDEPFFMKNWVFFRKAKKQTRKNHEKIVKLITSVGDVEME